MIEQYCSRAGFKIINSYEAISPEMVFESLEILLKWLWSTTHGVFDPTVVTEEQRYYPYSSRNGNPPPPPLLIFAVAEKNQLFVD